MIAPFDIFRKDEAGELVWCEEAKNLDEAKMKIEALAKSRRATFVIFCQKTGERVTVEPESV
jgi:hypothetical protein